MVDDSKRDILDAAKYLFAKNGYEGTSIRHIAKKACVAKSLIYYYFDNKEDILTEILEEGTSDIFKVHEKMSNIEEELTESYMLKIMEILANKCSHRRDVIRIMIQELIKGTHKENNIFSYADTYLDYVKKRSEKHFNNDEEAKMKFIIEFIFVGGLPFHLYLIFEDFIAEKYGFEKEKMWKAYKDIYKKDYISSVYSKINKK